MFPFVLPILCLHAFIQLALVFVPRLWREIDRKGVRWHNLLVLLFLPAFLVVLIVGQLATSAALPPAWQLVVAFLAIDAYLVAIGLAAVALYRRRQRTA